MGLDQVLPVRLNASDVEMIGRAARASNVAPSTFIRRAARLAALEMVGVETAGNQIAATSARGKQG